ncbi:MAG: hypothetical protein ABI091_26505 [Ferruginibacter sp.]
MLQSKIIALLLLICSICKGQTFTKLSDSTALYYGDTIRTNDTVKSWHFIDAINSEKSVQYDTIKCEMLVTSTDEINNKVIKIIGYEVRQVSVEPAGWNQYGDGMTFNKTEQHYYSHVEWLDIIKQPLKNIRVWLSNKIN